MGHRSPIVPGDQAEGRALMPRVFAGASVTEQELPGKTKDGRPINVRAHFAPIADEAGHILGAISLMEDTSELDRLQAELFEASKLESVGRLAGGIAHDFNNILTAIIGFAELSIDEPAGTDLSEYVTGIRDAAERAAGLTQQLLAFSRRQMLAPQVLAVNDVASGVESMLRRLIGEQIELKMMLDPDAGFLRVDRTQLEQVILNLTLNSRDAMPTGGKLVVQTGHVHYTHASRNRPRETQRRRLRHDLGKRHRRGHGRGDPRPHLRALLHDQARQGHRPRPGHHLRHHQAVGRLGHRRFGTRATARRSASSSPRSCARRCRSASRPPDSDGVRIDAKRSGRILLVEDEEGLRGIAKRVLARAGFDVTAAAGPGRGDPRLRFDDRAHRPAGHRRGHARDARPGAGDPAAKPPGRPARCCSSRATPKRSSRSAATPRCRSWPSLSRSNRCSPPSMRPWTATRGWRRASHCSAMGNQERQDLVESGPSAG